MLFYQLHMIYVLIFITALHTPGKTISISKQFASVSKHDTYIISRIIIIRETTGYAC